MNTTCHSEYGSLRTVYLKRPQEAMIDNERIGRTWKELNFMGPPNLEQAMTEYGAFESLIRMSSAEIRYLPVDADVTMDSMYCRDASLATDFGMILCNMGKMARKHEPAACRKAFAENGVPIMGSIEGTGTLEGGDMAWLDTRTLAVGRTYRTNTEGIRQLKSLLEPRGIEIVIASLPHYRGQADVFHLMSIISPVDRDLAVVYSPLMPIPFRERLLNLGYGLVEVPDAEFDSMGCNVLAIGPRKVVMVAGNPITRSRLIQAGCTVYQYDGADISVKGGGGPTCLTRPLLRQLED
jgi:N-dimethylarginine dimethylaminohydrolase